MKAKPFRKYAKSAFETYVPRKVISGDWEAGVWVRHVPSKTWFEAYEEFDDAGIPMLVGFGFYHSSVVVPISECVHAYDPSYED
jgi:hypothetical protein